MSLAGRTRQEPAGGAAEASGPWSMTAVRRLLPAGWLFVRLVLGIEWLRAGWEKIGDPGWTDEPRGGAVEGFLRGAIAKSTEGEHPEVQHWFHNLADDFFLPNADVFAFLVAYGELLVGIALLAGFLTRLSVLFGAAMNLTFLFAGTTSTNAPMLILGIAMAALGAGAGTYGLDRWVLPWLERAARPRLVDAGASVAVAAAAGFAAWLAWIATDTSTWVAAMAVAVVVAAGLRAVNIRAQR